MLSDYIRSTQPQEQLAHMLSPAARESRLFRELMHDIDEFCTLTNADMSTSFRPELDMSAVQTLLECHVLLEERFSTLKYVPFQDLPYIINAIAEEVFCNIGEPLLRQLSERLQFLDYALYNLNSVTPISFCGAHIHISQQYSYYGLKSMMYIERNIHELNIADRFLLGCMTSILYGEILLREKNCCHEYALQSVLMLLAQPVSGWDSDPYDKVVGSYASAEKKFYTLWKNMRWKYENNNKHSNIMYIISTYKRCCRERGLVDFSTTEGTSYVSWVNTYVYRNLLFYALQLYFHNRNVHSSSTDRTGKYPQIVENIALPETKDGIDCRYVLKHLHSATSAHFPEQILCLFTVKHSGHTLPIILGVDEYTLNCLLIPRTQTSINALRMIYGLPKADILTPLPSMYADLGNPASILFPDMMKHVMPGVTYAGETDITSFIFSRAPDSSAGNDEQFHKFWI